MPVKPRGTRWQASVSHQGTRYRRDFETKKEALQWEADSKASLLRGGNPEVTVKSPPRALEDTLGGLLKHIYETHWAVQSTGEKSFKNAKAIVDLIGTDLPINQLTRAEIDKARAEIDKARAGLLKLNSPATVNRKVAAIAKLNDTSK